MPARREMGQITGTIFSQFGTPPVTPRGLAVAMLAEFIFWGGGGGIAI